jgi:hypothetical protein
MLSARTLTTLASAARLAGVCSIPIVQEPDPAAAQFARTGERLRASAPKHPVFTVFRLS